MSSPTSGTAHFALSVTRCCPRLALFSPFSKWLLSGSPEETGSELWTEGVCSPQFAGRSVNSPCHGLYLEMGPLGLIRLRRGHEVGAPIMGFVPLQGEEEKPKLSFSLSLPLGLPF